MKHLIACLVFAGCLTAGATAEAETLALFDFDVAPADASSDTDLATAVSVITTPAPDTDFGVPSPSVSDPTGTALAFSASSESSSPVSFFQFTISPEPGTAAIEFESLGFDFAVASASATESLLTFFVSTSVDDFASSLSVSPSISLLGAGTLSSNATFDLSVLGPQTEAVTFRIDPDFGGAFNTGSLTTRAGQIDNITVTGAAVLVPEPSAATIALAALAMLGHRRQKATL